MGSHRRWAWLLAVFAACTGCAALYAPLCQLDAYGVLSDCGEFAPPGLFLALSHGNAHHCAVTHPLREARCWPPVAPAAEQRPSWVSQIHAMASGMRHTCAVWGSRRILSCWGGIRGVNNTAPVNVTRGVRMLAKSDPDAEHVCFQRESNNDVSCFGRNDWAQLGLGRDAVESLVVASASLRAD
jgi:hypothetical protein